LPATSLGRDNEPAQCNSLQRIPSIQKPRHHLAVLARHIADSFSAPEKYERRVWVEFVPCFSFKNDGIAGFQEIAARAAFLPSDSEHKRRGKGIGFGAVLSKFEAICNLYATT